MAEQEDQRTKNCLDYSLNDPCLSSKISITVRKGIGQLRLNAVCESQILYLGVDSKVVTSPVGSWRQCGPVV